MSNEASAYAELAAMHARGEITRDEYSRAKQLLEDELATSRPEPKPAPKFACSDTTPQRGSGIFSGFKTLAQAFGILIGGFILAGATGQTWLGTPIALVFIVMTIKAIYECFFGFPEHVRVGPCPNCGTQVTIRNQDGAPGKCWTCRRPMILKGTQIHDVS